MILRRLLALLISLNLAFAPVAEVVGASLPSGDTKERPTNEKTGELTDIPEGQEGEFQNEHAYPKRAIRNKDNRPDGLTGFKDLTRKQQNKILNARENLHPMRKRLNQVKTDKVAPSKLEGASDRFLELLKKKVEMVKDLLQERIDAMIKSNGPSGPPPPKK